MTKLQTFKDVQAVGADTHTGCLVLFQQGAVDAITGDDTVLAGLAAQDPYAEVVQAPPSPPSRTASASTRSTSTSCGSSTASSSRCAPTAAGPRATTRWLADSLGKAPAPPTPVYGRAP